MLPERDRFVSVPAFETQLAMQLAEKRKLDALAAHLAPEGGDPPARYLFSRAGFTADLHAAAKADGRLYLVDLAELGAPVG